MRANREFSGMAEPEGRGARVGGPGEGQDGLHEINSISTRGKEGYAHHITTGPFRFSDLPLSLIF